MAWRADPLTAWCPSKRWVSSIAQQSRHTGGVAGPAAELQRERYEDDMKLISKRLFEAQSGRPEGQGAKALRAVLAARYPLPVRAGVR